MKLRHMTTLLTALTFAACADPVSEITTTTQVTGNLRFVNGFHGAMNVLVDGVPVITNVPLGSAAGADVASGQHSIALQAVGGAAGSGDLVSFGAANFTAVLIASTVGGQPHSNFLLDTNAIVPAGATKLRVAHYAAAAPQIDIWRTQPDFGTPIRVQFPFNAGVTSPYLQSTVGDWRVMVSTAIAGCCGSMPDTLANTGVIAVAGGQSRTVVVTDGAAAGTVKVVVVDP